MPNPIALELPWPPSINNYWRRNGNRYFINPKGMEYRNLIIYKTNAYRGTFNKHDRISMEVLAYPPDRRRRDLDNLFKCLGDSLQHAHVYPDDSQIDHLSIRRMPEFLNKVIITLKKME